MANDEVVDSPILMRVFTNAANMSCRTDNKILSRSLLDELYSQSQTLESGIPPRVDRSGWKQMSIAVWSPRTMR